MANFEEALLEACDSVTINLNDVFAYACADSDEICSWDIAQLKPLFEEHGTALFEAYFSVKRGCKPISPGPGHKEARKALVELKKRGDLWFE